MKNVLLVIAAPLFAGLFAALVTLGLFAILPPDMPEPEIDPHEFCIAACLNSGMVPVAVDLKCNTTRCWAETCTCAVEDRD